MRYDNKSVITPEVDNIYKMSIQRVREYKETCPTSLGYLVSRQPLYQAMY